MARKLPVEKEVDDMTECSICTEVFTDPRVLPCIHTFCLKCLLNYGKDIPPGDDMPCPLCRKEFTIPDDGLAGIQKNFWMEKLLHARRLSAGEEASLILCDVCSSESDEASAKDTSKRASMYCVHCQQNYCEQCSRSHTKIKTTASHSQVEIGKQAKEKIAFKLPATCEIHKDEEIKVYCLECKVAICVMCFIKSHKTHDCSDIEEVSVDLRKQMESDTDKAADRLKKTGEVLSRFEKERIDLGNYFAGIEDEINTEADKLIAAVQRDRVKLLSEVESIKQKRIKQLETGKQEVEHHMAALESFRRYSETLLSSGTACDVTRSAISLHDRADELVMYDVISHVDISLPPLNVSFLSAARDTDAENLIGNLVEIDMTPSQPAVTHVIPKGKEVGGVTSLGNDVFVVRWNSQQIEVYDAVTFTLQRCLAIPQLGQNPRGLAVCPSNNCIYASDYRNSSIHRVELSGSNAVMTWSVARHPRGLTVNRAQNLLVVSEDKRKLQEFTTKGILLQNIQLDAGSPWHSIDMENGQFVVSFDPPRQSVCLVDRKGAVIRSYGRQTGSQVMNVEWPAGLAVDKHGNILVADYNSHRLSVLDSSLTSAREMSVSVDGGLRYPCSLWYDKSRGRLYVGELDGGRVIVIDHLKDFSASQVFPSSQSA